MPRAAADAKIRKPKRPCSGFKCGCRCEKLVALNDKIEVAAALAGEICRIENGYLTAIEPLGTVLGHEKRTRYEFFGGSLRELPAGNGLFHKSGAYAELPAGNRTCIDAGRSARQGG